MSRDENVSLFDGIDREFEQLVQQVSKPMETIALEVTRYQTGPDSTVAVGINLRDGRPAAIRLRPDPRAGQSGHRERRALSEFHTPESPVHTALGGVIGFNGCVFEKDHNGTSVYSARRAFTISRSPGDADVRVGHANLFIADLQSGKPRIGARLIVPDYSSEVQSLNEMKEAMAYAFTGPGDAGFFVRMISPAGDVRASECMFRPTTDVTGVRRPVSPEEGVRSVWTRPMFQHWLHLLPTVTHGVRMEVVGVSRLWTSGDTRDRWADSYGTKTDVFMPYLSFEVPTKKNDPFGRAAQEGRETVEVPVYVPSIIATRANDSNPDYPYLNTCEPCEEGRNIQREYLEGVPTMVFTEAVSAAAANPLSPQQKTLLMSNITNTYRAARDGARQEAERRNGIVLDDNATGGGAQVAQNNRAHQTSAPSQNQRVNGATQRQPQSAPTAAEINDEELMGAAEAMIGSESSPQVGSQESAPSDNAVTHEVASRVVSAPPAPRTLHGQQRNGNSGGVRATRLSAGGGS